MSATLLVELFTEELPPKALKRLGEAFAAGLTTALSAAGLLEPASASTGYASPRRLAVSITAVLPRAPDKAFRQKLLPVGVAFDAAGAPTPALLKKLSAIGLAADAWTSLERAPDGKAEALFHNGTQVGASLVDGLQKALDDTLAKLPIPKLMRYQRPDGTDVQFVRPAHRLLALHGGTVVPVKALGLEAGFLTVGHRQMSSGTISIATAFEYPHRLMVLGKVVASFAERRQRIEDGLRAKAGEDTLIAPDALLDEVTGLVEWPVVYEGRFDEAFLDVPQECLILTMQQNQKYFALADASGRLRNRFLLVSNLETVDPTAIVSGNERVLRARLADAKFFFDQDRRTPLADRVQRLASVVHHNKLGSQLDRVQRTCKLAAQLAHLLSAAAPALAVDPALAERAAWLAKADLVTDMVGEFPELQGVIGEYYARHDGEDDAVAAAIEQHYHPRFANDSLPTAPLSLVVALSDKLDTLVGLWTAAGAPTGDKDPFGLRRQALGVLRMLAEHPLPLDLRELVGLAMAQFPPQVMKASVAPDLYRFFLDRLSNYLRDRGHDPRGIDAVLSLEPSRIDQVPAKLDAVAAFGRLPESEALAAANKRVRNILRKEGASAGRADPSLMTEAAEKALHAELSTLEPEVVACTAREDYAGALARLACVRAAVDRFFDEVMVMTDDAAVRANRIALLQSLERSLNQVADISRLAA
ncbi:MAG: glycine--tRNA ligase subunit beta [bacterium]|jgi:glycyl-tRNA synthetase beta chain|nr:glycine--tRNA ligase subunit beta [Betaproteobacteria bacterium]